MKLTYDIAFSQAKGINGATALEMLNRVGSSEAFFTLPSSQLSAMTGITSPIFDDSYRQSLLDQAQKEAMFVRQNDITSYLIGSKDYPRRLADCSDAPAMVYKLGKCNLDSAHIIGIVGTRHATAYGIDFTTKLVTDLAAKIDNLVVVSGLAFGIDVAAHKAALAAKVPTVGVLAHGLNRIYPAEHRQTAVRMIEGGGALVTEYTSAAPIFQGNFLARNRIVAGICDCLVVVESDRRGGAMATARTAMHYNRDVFAVPGRTTDLYSRGTNSLIKSNIAALVTGADDVIAAMRWQSRADAVEQAPQLFPTLTPQQQTVIDCIKAHPDYTINDMCVSLEMSFASLSNVIFQLEMADLITSIPGGRYQVK